MAKKKYRISKPNVLGGAVANSNKGELPNMQTGGQTASNQSDIQAFMLSIYNLFKQGMTKEDVEDQLLSQNIPYDTVEAAINVVKKYMEEKGEWTEAPEMTTDFSVLDPKQEEKEPSALKQKQDALMESYGQQSMDVAMSDDDDEEFDDLLFRENPYMGQQPEMQMGGPMAGQMDPQMNPQQQEEGPQDNSKTPYYPGIELYGGPIPQMKKGGKVSRKKFMRNVLKRFEAGGQGQEAVLKSGPKKDTLTQDVEKATKGFVSAVQGKAKEATAKELYSLAEQSGDPKLQQILMSGNQQQEQPMPMAQKGMQYAETGDEMRERMKSTPKKGSRMYSFLLNNPIPEGEPEAIPDDPELKDPVYGRTVYKDSYRYSPYGMGYGVRDILFPANRFMGYRPKYYVDPRLGKPVARDVYGRTLFGGKKYIDYYEMPDEDFDPEILRRRDINKRARQGNRFLRKALKGKLDYKDILDRGRGRDDDSDEDMSSMDPRVIDTGRRRRDNRTFSQMMEPDDRIGRRHMRQRLNRRITDQPQELERLKRQQEAYEQNQRIQDILNTPSFGPGQVPFNQSMLDNPTDFSSSDPNMRNQTIEYFADPRSQRGRFSYGTGGALDRFVLGGFDPTESYKDPYAYNIEMDNPSDEMINADLELFKGANDAVYGDDDEQKKKLIGIKNREKLGITDGMTFNTVTNWALERPVGALENYQTTKAMRTELTEDNLAKRAGDYYADRGDWDRYGNFRPNEQGFIGSTNNPGAIGTASKFGGPTPKKGDIVEMNARQLQQFMEAGGQIEFV